MIEVMSEEKRKILISYRDQPLANVLYSSATRSAYYAEDFLETGSFIYVMSEVLDCESDITAAGKKFLSEFMGLKKVARILMDHYYTGEFTEAEVMRDLEAMVPNEVGDFIREAREES